MRIGNVTVDRLAAMRREFGETFQRFAMSMGAASREEAHAFLNEASL